MKKTGILLLVLSVVFMTGCNRVLTPPESMPEPESEAEVTVGIANPWEDTTLDVLEVDLGINVSIPESASSPEYRVLPSEGLYEVVFDYDGLLYTYRLKKTNAREDISGLFYTWTASVDTTVDGCQGTDSRAISADETVDLLLWYNESEGITHSLCTSAKDLDGFDIVAIAEKLVSGKAAPVKIADETDYKAVYSPILEEILEVINNGYDDSKDYKYISSGIMEKVMYEEKEKLLKNMGYVIEDISGDGVPELLIGETASFGDEPEASYLYDVYTVKNGEASCTLDGWARNSYRYLGDGKFYNVGSGGAMYTLFGQLHLSKDGSEIIWDDCYFSYDKNDGTEIGYYHNTTGVWDPEEAEELDMSEDEFWKLMEDLKFELIDWNEIGSLSE